MPPCGWAYPLHACYRGGSGRTDAWAADPLIEESFQALLYGNPYCYYDGYSRGHQIPLGRPAPLNDGAERPDTFYASNMTPQNSDFNSGVWESLESKIRNNICNDTLYVVTGLLLRQRIHHDLRRQLRQQPRPQRQTVRPLPTHYFKVILRTRSGKYGESHRPVRRRRTESHRLLGSSIVATIPPPSVPTVANR